MKINIFSKLLFLLFILIIVPLAIVSYILIGDARQMGEVAIEKAQQMGSQNLIDGTSALNDLGSKIIMQKAIDVAKQVEVYIKSHPSMTVADLQKDEYFKKIAVQPVGETGYTALTDVETLICRFHSSDSIVNLDLHNLAEKLPGFWSVMAKSQEGQESEGYYDWQEKDGSMKKKYMYIAIADVNTADNVMFSVAATTYISEFSQPVNKMKTENSNTLNSAVESLRTLTRDMYTKDLILLVLILLIAIVIGFVSAKSISQPIRELKNATDKATMGDFDAEMPPIRGNDEVAELIASTEMLIAALKQKSGKG